MKFSLKELKSLESSIISNPKNLNNLTKLMEALTKCSDAELVLFTSESCMRIFNHYHSQGSFFTVPKLTSTIENEAKKQVSLWLTDNFKNFVELMFQILKDNDALKYKSIAFQALLSCIKLEWQNECLAEQKSFPVVRFYSLFKTVISTDAAMAEKMIHDYVSQFDDFRYYSFKALNGMLAKIENFDDALQFNNILTMLLSIKKLNGNEANLYFDPMGSSEVMSHQRQLYSNLWLKFLQKIPEDRLDAHRAILLRINDRVFPLMSNPRLLIDYLTDTYNLGSGLSLLALNGLFVLITHYNLDYPDFYIKLYALLDHRIFHVKYRPRLFHLLEIFLSSPLLPSYLIAAFVKRMARLALFAPPGSILWLIPFIYNIMKKHESLLPMIQRVEMNESDPYDHETLDPSKANAIKSSLWELTTFQNHFHPQVATMSKIFQEKMNKPEYPLEDFNGISYIGMLEEEIQMKRVNKPAALSYPAPTELF
ncbi:CBF-domain-containing protein [Rozella allomycis CSF55]|uniref:CBF-domain-containing protein n=1 Tax=Rozella allomycis (strain CSF55) TaxID=988480 RepID=A0A075AZQ5_ROZAC|nr:CCAAT-binding factor domain-containing protein [Rozella allomycis CSF55]RKP20306.1 CBF-domain-containing protein [Rozella allomycis CSF55]|eukprot:EPZ34167.1 CCAAT-binding factor domain-containing protein [Rozella allomycis CSF55]